MKKELILVALLMIMIVIGIVCRPSVDTPVSNTLTGKWTLTDIQAPGIGPAGVWSVASPAGQWMSIQSGGQISGTVFPNASGCQVIDSVTLKLVDPSQTAGFRLFNYKVDTVAQVLFFYIRPPDGRTFCIEGCGAYKFRRG